MPAATAKPNRQPPGLRIGKSIVPLASPHTLRRDCTLLLPFGALLGIVTFIVIYGVGVLNPTNVAWLDANAGDLQQHYTGWVMYRQTDWAFPIGLTDKLTYPYPVSITYTDSIPLFAVFFKLLSPILPETFQYFGLWGMLSYILTGTAGVLLVRSFSAGKIYCLVGSAFFCTAPPIIFRMYSHTALGGQWILLWALVFWAYGDKMDGLKRNLLYWCALLFITAWVHPYFLPMVAGILLCYLVHNALYKGQILAHLATLVAPLLTAVFSLWVLGAFVGNGSMQNGGLGLFGFNLNQFYNPMFDDWSTFLNGRAQGALQYEGYAYMGVGLLALLALCAALFLWRLMRALLRCGVKQTLRHIPVGVALLVLLGGIFGVIAVSPVVTFGGLTLFTIPYPSFVLEILSVFRATGRFVWVSFYILLLGGLWLLHRWAPKRLSILLLCALFCLQMVDLAPFFAWRRASVSENVENANVLASGTWNEVAAAHEHLVVESVPSYTTLFSLGLYARNHHATLSNYGLARNLPEAENTIRAYYPAAAAGTLPDDTALVLTEQKNATILRWLNGGDTWFYEIDGLVVCTGTPLQTAAEHETLPPFAKGPLDVLEALPYSLYLATPTEEGSIQISPNGDIRDQRIYLPAGAYEVTFTGEELSVTNVHVHSEALGKGGIPTEAIATDDGVTLRFTLTEDLYDLEFWAENPLEQDILLTGITLKTV